MSLSVGFIIGFVVFALSIIGLFGLSKCANNMDKGKPTYNFDQSMIAGYAAIVFAIAAGSFVAMAATLLIYFFR